MFGTNDYPDAAFVSTPKILGYLLLPPLQLLLNEPLQDVKAPVVWDFCAVTDTAQQSVLLQQISERTQSERGSTR